MRNLMLLHVIDLFIQAVSEYRCQSINVFINDQVAESICLFLAVAF